MKEKLTKFRCDTCNCAVTFPNDIENASGWGRAAIKMGQVWIIGDDHAWGDICPSCLSSFNEWMIGRKRDQARSEK